MAGNAMNGHARNAKPMPLSALAAPKRLFPDDPKPSRRALFGESFDPPPPTPPEPEIIAPTFGLEDLELARAEAFAEGRAAGLAEAAASHAAREVAALEATARADTVVMYSTPGAAASLIAEFGRLEYTPRILATSTLLDPSLLANPGMQGALIATFMRLPSVIVGEGNGDPIADEVFNTIVVPYAPEAAQDPFRALAGVGFAQPLIVALEAAGPDLTREALLEALRGISGYDEGLFPNLDFTEGYQGNNSVMLLQMTPEGLRPASDYLTY